MNRKYELFNLLNLTKLMEKSYNYTPVGRSWSSLTTYAPKNNSLREIKRIMFAQFIGLSHYIFTFIINFRVSADSKSNSHIQWSKTLISTLRNGTFSCTCLCSNTFLIYSHTIILKSNIRIIKFHVIFGIRIQIV